MLAEYKPIHFNRYALKCYWYFSAENMMKLSFLIISDVTKHCTSNMTLSINLVCQMVFLLRITLVWKIVVKRIVHTTQIFAHYHWLWPKFIINILLWRNRVSSSFLTFLFPLNIIFWRKKLLQILPIQSLCFKGKLIWDKVLSIYKNLNDWEQFQAAGSY